MLSENEKEARRRFFEATGKTPEGEGRDSAKAMGKAMLAMIAVAAAAGLFYLLG